MERQVVRYSEAFKRQVVLELERGEFSCVESVKRHYGIAGATTVKKWVRRFGKGHLLKKVVRVETPDEKREVERLREENQRLKLALADTRMEQLLDQAYLEVWCEDAGLDVAEVKKKLDAELSRRRAAGGQGGKA